LTAHAPRFGDSLDGRFFEKFLEKEKAVRPDASIFSIQKKPEKTLKNAKANPPETADLTKNGRQKEGKN